MKILASGKDTKLEVQVSPVTIVNAVNRVLSTIRPETSLITAIYRQKKVKPAQHLTDTINTT